MVPYLEALGHRVDLVEMYVGGRPARVQINAPLALQQAGAHELLKMLLFIAAITAVLEQAGVTPGQEPEQASAMARFVLDDRAELLPRLAALAAGFAEHFGDV